ncbi:hypothetical protein G4H71_04460 [Rhodococcus triatomae]|uniref:GyrI-like small molecule binding domain-containing protein n=1 Tax=Rhodococcus triatomae TaxID=300028 RepID=A0A1G7ZTW3_9NOCA|nr:GyrI-like domain-containing protein [Rhodococcus triatomae]QNG17951.1 hypothetical protein G4H72_03585 [Rhodococcus triatomae]QNG22381.1 hypothetical protein G4H71_04460 [Rhodococcus triatomae]SDH12057.1 hypothetical protein SAMN05444695_101217 [Rhodococcus triatomae]
MRTFDVKTGYRDLYAQVTTEFTQVDVPEMRYAAIDGTGTPDESADHVAAVEALYSAGYTEKFESKRYLGCNFVVGPLEALWHSDDPYASRRDATSWTMMIAQPEWITAEMLADAAATSHKKRKNPALERIRLTTVKEGRSVQVLHVGPYEEAGPTLARMYDEYLPEHGLTVAGPHHEIYLSDARRVPPEQRRTILRRPVRPL